MRSSAVMLVIALPLACADGVSLSRGGNGEGVGEGTSSLTSATTDSVTVGSTGPATSATDGSMTSPTTDPTTGIDDSSESGGGPSTGTTSEVSTATESSSASTVSDSDTGPAVCGDGVTGGSEACDDGGESATCNDDCTTARCGDAIPNMTAGEQCDDGGESAACDSDCTLATCGDGVANMVAAEDCDDGGVSAACDDDGTFAQCGDGTVNAAANEACDDGNGANFDGCGSDCAFELLSCHFVNGYNWCLDPTTCGQACNQVCAVDGLVPVADSVAWLAAQNDPAECLALAQAFGIGDSTSLNAYTYACAEAAASIDGTLIAPLYCSTDAGCPDAHRNNADALGVPCAQGGAFQSICPCT